MAPAEHLQKYCDTAGTDEDESQYLNEMAGEIIRAVEVGADTQILDNGGQA